MVACLLLVLTRTALAWSPADPIQASDWLVAGAPSIPTLTEGTLGGVPSITLSNGLAARTFVLPPAPSDTGSGSSCPNPGNRTIERPDGSRYAYYGLPCAAESDCGQCASDGTCRCDQWSPYLPQGDHCCIPDDVAPTPSPAGTMRGFATALLSRQGGAGRELADAGAQLLRATSAEALVTLDGVTYGVGGLLGQADYSFLNTSLLPQMRADPAAFVYSAHRARSPTARFAWKPGARHSDNASAWPPAGLTLEVDFVAPPGSAVPAAHRGVTITVVHELYAGIPLFSKWVTIASNGSTPVVVDRLTTEVLYPTAGALDYWPTLVAGSLTAKTVTGRIHLSSELTRGGDTTVLQPDARCTTCVQGNSLRALNSSYARGPAAQLGAPPAFHGSTFSSFHSYILLHDSDDSERQALAVRRMYRTLAPQVTENPIFMHLTDTTPAGIKKAVDQCAEVGFEMIIMSFGTSLNMENKDPKYIASVKASVDYAHSKGIEIGGYNLMSSSRTVAKGGNCIGPDGKPNGASCLASDWSDDYFTTIKNFITQTGFDMIETDGPYEGHTCASTTHAHHRGLGDSVWTQYERSMVFYEWCREHGIYVHAPDPFYMRGINKVRVVQIRRRFPPCRAQAHPHPPPPVCVYIRTAWGTLRATGTCRCGSRSTWRARTSMTGRGGRRRRRAGCSCRSTSTTGAGRSAASSQWAF